MKTIKQFVAKLRAKMKQRGPDAPFFPHIAAEMRDPYSNEPVPFEAAPLDPNAAEVDCGDTGSKLNPVYRGMFRASMKADGSVEITGRDGTPDLHQQLQRKMYARKNRIIAEWGSYSAISTQQNASNGIDPTDTPIATTTPEHNDNGG